MAVTITPVNVVPANGLRATFDVKASADADSSATITHGLPSATDTNVVVTLEPTNAAFYASQWTVTSRGASTVVLTKGNGAGSGNAANQVRVTVEQIHSIQE